MKRHHATLLRRGCDGEADDNEVRRGARQAIRRQVSLAREKNNAARTDGDALTLAARLFADHEQLMFRAWMSQAAW